MRLIQIARHIFKCKKFKQRVVLMYVTLLGIMLCIVGLYSQHSNKTVFINRPIVVEKPVFESGPQSHVVENNSCSLWTFPRELKVYDNPRIKLDPNRYLYGGNVQGPNNQIVGLIESIYIAIKLNR